MGQLLPSNASTTESVRSAIRLCKERIAKTAKRFNVNPKTVVKCRKRSDPKDLPMGPKNRRSRVLTTSEEEAVIAFRNLTQLPLDDVLYSLQETIPYLTRSTLHRCVKRHGCSVLPKANLPITEKKKFKSYSIGYFHMDRAAVRTAEGRLYLYVAMDRVSKFAYAALHTRQTKRLAAAFLRNLIKAVPYTIHKILTDNGIQFTHYEQHRHAFPHIKEFVFCFLLD